MSVPRPVRSESVERRRRGWMNNGLETVGRHSRRSGVSPHHPTPGVERWWVGVEVQLEPPVRTELWKDKRFGHEVLRDSWWGRQVI